MEYNTKDMAFDGSIVACICDELNKEILGAKIVKIIQPEKEEILLTVRRLKEVKRIIISVNPSLPLMYLTEFNKPAPMEAPAFCMLLRKYLSGGEIIKISQPSLERIIEFDISHYDELGDISVKKLTVELMGKYSNIIFRDENKIIDSIKHVSPIMSSVREVLPGREYFIPFEGKKLDPLLLANINFPDSLKDEFFARIFSGSESLSKSLYTNITGLSPILSEEIIYQTGLDSDKLSSALAQNEKDMIFYSLIDKIKQISDSEFNPLIVYDKDMPLIYLPFEFKLYGSDYDKVYYESISALLFEFYSKKQLYTNLHKKTSELRQVVQTLLSRNYKKYDLQQKQLKDTEKKDKYKLYGDLIIAYGYNVEAKSTSMKAINYNTNEEITIPLDPGLSAIDNGKRYYKKYDKLKRTKEALSDIILRTEDEIKHLEELAFSIDLAADAADIAEITSEMIVLGYLKRHVNTKKTKNKASQIKSKPLHFLSSDGFDIYVGKNNFQNDYISFKLADANDWWFHAKNYPGSHVIVKCAGQKLPDKSFAEAASLAAHYSKAENADKVEIDYTLRKNLKKPPGANRGYVIYHTNFSMMAATDISNIKEIK